MKCDNFSAPRFGRCAMEESDHRHRLLLYARGKRRGNRRTAKQTDEIASSHAALPRRGAAAANSRWHVEAMSPGAENAPH
jgi:hypothetical protein